MKEGGLEAPPVVGHGAFGGEGHPLGPFAALCCVVEEIPLESEVLEAVVGGREAGAENEDEGVEDGAGGEEQEEDRGNFKLRTPNFKQTPSSKLQRAFGQGLGPLAGCTLLRTGMSALRRRIGWGGLMIEV
ncbi:MAG: hypothetical protein C5B50_07710 [Verrucomicrobia bacterium]|nr:MAG: hypothetical protein C5B50_07710 [Verrucomicrobiota bacterium]